MGSCVVRMHFFLPHCPFIAAVCAAHLCDTFSAVPLLSFPQKDAKTNVAVACKIQQICMYSTVNIYVPQTELKRRLIKGYYSDAF